MARPGTTNLPPAATRFVGRHDELAQLKALYDEGQRLVTVFGPAGTGKTRLAIALGRSAPADLSLSGVWLCELAEARDLDGLCAVLERTLGIPPRPAGDPDNQVAGLGRAIAARGPILLILDNFEQLVALGPSTVGVWLRDAPDLRVLVTSREQLRVAGEVRFELLPLSLPAKPEAEGATKGLTGDAVELFVERVRALDPSFAVNASNAPLVAGLVRRLEGIPLALELAASRVELLGLQGLLESLDQRLDVLVDGSRDRSGRHATLRAAIDSSWSALNEAERRCLVVCSVFRGGFSPAAAAEVVGPTSTAALTQLQSLRNKSLLRTRQSEGRPGHARFAMFEAIRAFASEQLDAAELREEAEQRHAAYFMEWGETVAEQVGGPTAADALDMLADDRDNLVATQRWALGHHQSDAGEAALRSALVLDALAAIRGPFASHRTLLEETLSAANESELPAELWVKALTARARARSFAGLGAAAGRDLEAALGIATNLGDAAAQASVLADVAVRHHRQRETSTARVLYERALDHAQTAGDQHLQGRILGNLAALLHDRRELEQALTQYRAALSVLREVGDRRLEAIHVANLGLAEQERGERSRARGHFEAALQLLGALGDQRLEAIVLGNLGTLEHEEDRLGEARTCHERALAILRSVGDRHSEALCLGRLARTYAAGDHVDEASARIAAAERILGRHEDALASEAIRIDRGFVDAANARRETLAGNPKAASSHDAAARERIAHACAPSEAEASWAERSDDIRAAVRLLERELSRRPSEADPQPTREVIEVGPDGQWLQTPAGERHDLRRRKAIRLILVKLVERQRDAPGSGLDLEALQEAGWPGERMVARAGANRVYVALTTLRKLGLRKHLISQDDGYLLDPAMPAIRAAAG